MKTILFASAALSLMAIAPASAQMMGNGMGMAAGPKSCVSGGQFVPCPPPGMQPGMAMQAPGMGRKMTRREMREQRRMSQQAM